MTTIEALRLQIDTLQLERQQFECKNSKLELEKNRYKEAHEHLIAENEQLKALYEELLKKIEEEGAVGGDKASETANIAQTDVEQLKSECEQLEKDLESWKVKYNELEKELNDLRTHCGNLEKDLADFEGWKRERTELQLKVTNIENNLELECFRAVARERKQWEACEERLVQQLRQSQQQNAPTALPSRNMKPVEHTGNEYHHTQAAGYQQSPQVSRVENPVCIEPATSALLTQPRKTAKQPQLQQLVQQVEDIKPKVSHGIVTGGHGSFYQSSLGQSYLPSRNGQPVEPTGNGYQYNQAVGEVQLPQSDGVEAAKDHQQLPQVNRVQNPVFNESVTSAVLAQQLPPLPKFSGGEVNNGGMDTFQDWLEQFEMIANVCGWSPQARLVNLVTRLEGQAYAFFVHVQLNKRLAMPCWLQSYIRGSLQFTCKLCKVVCFMTINKNLGNQ